MTSTSTRTRESTTTFTSTAHRDGEAWTVVADQHPSVRSVITDLRTAASTQRDAIAVVTGLDKDAIRVAVRVAEHLTR